MLNASYCSPILKLLQNSLLKMFWIFFVGRPKFLGYGSSQLEVLGLHGLEKSDPGFLDSGVLLHCLWPCDNSLSIVAERVFRQRGDIQP